MTRAARALRGVSAGYADSYRHGEGDVRVIELLSNRLTSQRGTGRRMELDPLDEDLFLIVGTGGATLRFDRVDGRVAGVSWNDRKRAQRLR